MTPSGGCDGGFDQDETQHGEVGTTDDADGGLFGSDTGASMAVAAAAELIGTFLLIFCGTAVAVAAGFQRPTAGGAYDSLAVALGFGVMLSAVVAALGHVSGAHVNPAITSASRSPASSPGPTPRPTWRPSSSAPSWDRSPSG